MNRAGRALLDATDRVVHHDDVPVLNKDVQLIYHRNRSRTG